MPWKLLINTFAQLILFQPRNTVLNLEIQKKKRHVYRLVTEMKEIHRRIVQLREEIYFLLETSKGKQLDSRK